MTSLEKKKSEYLDLLKTFSDVSNVKTPCSHLKENPMVLKYTKTIIGSITYRTFIQNCFNLRDLDRQELCGVAATAAPTLPSFP